MAPEKRGGEVAPEKRDGEVAPEKKERDRERNKLKPYNRQHIELLENINFITNTNTT